MAKAFDAYHRWLGIPPAEQPPNHYRLLGVAAFESDADVIEGAADRQMAHVRTFQTGPHGALSQTILNEVAEAKVCLLDGERKAAYDRVLRSRLPGAASQPAGRPLPAAKPLPVAKPLPPPGSETTSPDAVAPPLVKTAPTGVRRRGLTQGAKIAAWTAAAAAAALAITLFILFQGAEAPKGGKSGSQHETAADVKSATSRDNVAQPPDEAGQRRAAPSGAKTARGQKRRAASPPPRVPNADREVAEEVLRRGGQLRLSVNGQLVEALKSADLPTDDFTVVEARLFDAPPEMVANLGFLARATRLESLALRRSRIGTASLASLAGHPGLKILNLEDTGLPTGVLKAILPLPALEVLLAANCEIKAQDLRDMATSKRLRALGLQSAKLGDDDLRLLKEFPDLQELILFGVPITDSGLAALAEAAPKLRVLVISMTEISDDGLSRLAPLKELTTLDIGYNAGLTGRGLLSLKELPALEWLKLEQTKIDDEALAAIAQLTTIEELLLGRAKITDAGLKHLALLTNLAHIDVKDTYVTAAGVAELQKALPQCRIESNLSPEGIAASAGAAPEAGAIAADRTPPGAEGRTASASKQPDARAGATAAASPPKRRSLADLAVERRPSATSQQLNEKAKSLKARAATARSSDELQSLAMEYWSLVDGAVDLDDYERAGRFATAMVQAARKTHDAGLMADLQSRVKRVQEMRAAYNTAKSASGVLARDADDAKSNGAWGRYLAWSKGHWNDGLRLLAKGADDVAAVAARELEAPQTSAACVALADDWWRIAEHEKGLARRRLEDHACWWYEHALSRMAPGDERSVEAKIERSFGNAKVWEIGAHAPSVQLGGADVDVGPTATVEFWVSTRAQDGPLLTKRQERRDGSLTFLVTSGRASVAGDGDFYRVDVAGSQAIGDGRWHHVAVVKSGKILQLLVDGRLAGTGESLESFRSQSS